jgi:hypothetical protein
MALVLVAYLLSRTDRMEDARAVILRVTRDHPDFYLPYYMLGAAAAGSGERESAIGLLQQVLRLVPGHVQAKAMLARLQG